MAHLILDESVRMFWHQLGTKLSLIVCLTELGKVVEHGRRVPLTRCQQGSKRKTKPDSVLTSHRMEAAVVHWTGDLQGDDDELACACELSAEPVTGSVISVSCE
jgi:hypothetical protein